LNFAKPFEVHTNVSGFVISGVLMQGHLIAFENKKLAGDQLRWLTHEKKLFAVMSCLKA